MLLLSFPCSHSYSIDVVILSETVLILRPLPSMHKGLCPFPHRFPLYCHPRAQRGAGLLSTKPFQQTKKRQRQKEEKSISPKVLILTLLNLPRQSPSLSSDNWGRSCPTFILPPSCAPTAISTQTTQQESREDLGSSDLALWPCAMRLRTNTRATDLDKMHNINITYPALLRRPPL